MRIKFRYPRRYVAGALLLFGLSAPVANAQDYATSANPLAFGPSQTIIDLNKVEWAPLELEGFGPGLEMVVLHGDLAHGSELILRTPAGYLIPNHNHTSAETYVWLKGDFTYINGTDGLLGYPHIIRDNSAGQAQTDFTAHLYGVGIDY